MKFFTKVMSVVLVLTLFSSCASIVSRSSWPLTVNTEPSGAKVTITDRKGITVFNGNSPTTIRLKSGDGFFAKQSYSIKLSMDGYSEKIIPVQCRLNGWYIGNIIFGGLIGILIVDPATGAMYRLDREYITETMSKTTANNQPALEIKNINEISKAEQAHLVAVK